MVNQAAGQAVNHLTSQQHSHQHNRRRNQVPARLGNLQVTRHQVQAAVRPRSLHAIRVLNLHPIPAIFLQDYQVVSPHHTRLSNQRQLQANNPPCSHHSSLQDNPPYSLQHNQVFSLLLFRLLIQALIPQQHLVLNHQGHLRYNQLLNRLMVQLRRHRGNQRWYHLSTPVLNHLQDPLHNRQSIHLHNPFHRLRHNQLASLQMHHRGNRPAFRLVFHLNSQRINPPAIQLYNHLANQQQLPTLEIHFNMLIFWHSQQNHQSMHHKQVSLLI